MRTWLGILLLILGLQAVGAQASDLSCLNQNEASEIFNSFRFRSNDSKRPLDFCAHPTLERAVYEALVFLKSLHWQSASSDEFNPGFLPADPYRFLIPRIKTLEVMVAPSSFCSGWEGARNQGHGVIFICPEIQSFSAFEIATILIHEARHSDPGTPEHVDCATGKADPFRGACDRSFEQLGAYAVGAEFSLKVARDSTLAPEVRAEALAQTVRDYSVRFVKRPFGQRKGILLETADGALKFYDGSEVFDFALKMNPKTQFFAVNAGGAGVFDSSLNRATRIMGGGVFTKLDDPLANFYIEKLSPMERGQVLDVYYGVNYRCLLFAERLRCMDLTGREIQNLALAPLRARGFLDVTYSTNFLNGIIYIVTEDGNSHALPTGLAELKALRTEDLMKNAKPSRSVNVSVLNGAQVGLQKDGTVQATPDGVSQWAPVPAFGSQKFIKLGGLIWWTEKFDLLRKSSGV
jgi:hypothetical protein